MQNHKINNKKELEEFICSNWKEVNAYIDNKQSELPIPLYSSIDIRESQNKFAPVDNNIYPAGFNNVCLLDLDYASDLFLKTVKKYAPEAKNVAVIPESNTKNVFYLDHLAFLQKALQDAGLSCSFVSFDPSLFPEEESSISLVSHSKFEIEILNGQNKNDDIDFYILNHDQSTPLPIDWDKIDKPVHPTPKIGWFRRQKSTHFGYYQKVANEFCANFSIDPSLIQARFLNEEEVDFSTKEGLERIGSKVDELLSDLPKGTKAFVKASQGTYGMGISVVGSGEEIISMNRKVRNKMDIGKNKIKFTSVLIQEGVDTILKYNDMPAEVTIYLVDGKSAGGFMRTNSQKGPDGNLNSRGMVFQKYCISEIKQDQDHKAKEATYSIIARLSTIAGGLEIKEVL